MENIVVGKQRIKTLWNWCEEGKFAVPEIQREFVWDRRRASDLLDSIYRKLPIGCILIWETRGDHRHLLRLNQILLPPHDPANPNTLFLIDGQQRLSVLYRARHGGSVINSYGVEINFDQLCLNLKAEEGEANFQFTRRPILGQHVPIKDILSSEWRRKVRRLSKWKRVKIRRCRIAISKYLVPVIKVRTNNLDEVRETFLRINSGGLRISKADRAFSKASRLDLRRLVRELKESLPNSFDWVEPRILQVALAVIQGQKDTSSQAVESAITKLEKAEFGGKKASRQFTRKWKNVSNCVKRAVDYLNNNLGVVNFSYLPSDLMIAVLAFFFHANNQAQPNAHQRSEIRKWFWATGVGRRYVGRGYYTNIRHDLDFFQRLGRRRTGRFNYRDRMSLVELRRTDYTSGGSLEIAFWLMLSKREPCYLESGGPMPLERTASVANRKDKHHIFPKSLLVRNEFTVRETNSLANMCYLVAEENQSIGSNKPAIYLEEFKRMKHFPRVMRSHLIPYRSNSALWNRNVRRAYRQFVTQRIDWIRKAFEKEAGTRLFRRE